MNYEVSKYPHGMFSWADLSSRNQEEAKAFYTGLFGWGAWDMPIGDSGSDYTTLHINGKRVAGLGQMQPEMVTQGVPSFWTVYVNVDDADAVAERITASGGSLMMPPMDIMTEGRMAIGIDPTGAAFGLWQARDHRGADVVNGPNMISWTELQTRDPQSAQAFYNAVFDWGHSYDEASNYHMFALNDRVQAGMMDMSGPNWDASIPANWQVFFRVEDIDAKVAKVRELGGNVMLGPFPMGPTARGAIVSDPHGATFTIIEGGDDFFVDAP